jgi:hypothetical protein
MKVLSAVREAQRDSHRVLDRKLWVAFDERLHRRDLAAQRAQVADLVNHVEQDGTAAAAATRMHLRIGPVSGQKARRADDGDDLPSIRLAMTSTALAMIELCAMVTDYTGTPVASGRRAETHSARPCATGFDERGRRRRAFERLVDAPDSRREHHAVGRSFARAGE